MAITQRISRVTSDAFNREHNTLVTANALGKIFTGQEVAQMDFNAAVNAGMFRFDSSFTNGPEKVLSGYVQINTTNPDYALPNAARHIRQIVFPDADTTAYTRVGNAVSDTSAVVWSDWSELGSGGMFSRFQELTEDQMAEPKTLYRSFNSFVLTLPDISRFDEGTYFGLEQYDNLGIVIDTNGGTIEDGRQLYDPISELLFRMVVQPKKVYWELVGRTTDEAIVNDMSIRPTVERIEYLEPQLNSDVLTSTRFVAYVTKDHNDNLVWSVESEDISGIVTKNLITKLVSFENEIYSYIHEHDTRYRLLGKLANQNIVAKASTFYRASGINVLTLPDPETDVEGRWLAIEQQEGTTYIVDSHLASHDSNRFVYDPDTDMVFGLSINANGYKWVIVNPSDYPSDVRSNSSYLDAAVKIRVIEATASETKLKELHITKLNASDRLVWVITTEVSGEIL